jgi:hypothetical protein
MLSAETAADANTAASAATLTIDFIVYLQKKYK